MKLLSATFFPVEVYHNNWLCERKDKQEGLCTVNQNTSTFNITFTVHTHTHKKKTPENTRNTVGSTVQEKKKKISVIRVKSLQADRESEKDSNIENKKKTEKRDRIKTNIGRPQEPSRPLRSSKTLMLC